MSRYGDLIVNINANRQVSWLTWIEFKSSLTSPTLLVVSPSPGSTYALSTALAANVATLDAIFGFILKPLRSVRCGDPSH